ncbi:MAG: radical SAM protein [Bryobacteraceae bacterium]|jgi:anaerobic magnesium-protoporphyrin IX monomethyl ester cyclase
MADVLLTHSNHIYFDRKQVKKMQPYPPLQTLLAAAALRERGIGIGLFDATWNNPEQGFAAALEAHRPSLAVVCEDDFNFLSKMCLGRNREVAFSMAAAARARGIPSAAHGSDASDHVTEYLDAGFDFVLIGEVETTLMELAEGRPRASIDGLAYRDAWSIRRNAPRELRTDLETLPQPAWDLVDMDQYRQAWQQAHGYFSLNMVSSRGCPYRCNWCAKPIYGNSYHARPPLSVASEMLHLKASFQPDHIWFADDIFALSPKWTFAFAAAVESLGAQVPFKMQSRCDLMTRDTVDALRRAGCAEVWMGAESGSQRILDAMEKGTRVKDIYRARENLRGHGIRAGFFLQFGYPGETWGEIEETIRMVREARPDDIGVSVSYPLPGTRFYETVSAQLGEKSNWCDSADLAMMFRGEYSSEFYRALADALHAEVRGGFDSEAADWERVRELERASVRLAAPNGTPFPVLRESAGEAS